MFSAMTTMINCRKSVKIVQNQQQERRRTSTQERRGTSTSTNKPRVSMLEQECVPKQRRQNPTHVLQVGAFNVSKRKQPSKESDNNNYTDEQSDTENKAKETVRNIQREQYVTQMTNLGYLQSEESQQLALKNHINKKLFCEVKFNTHENQMDVKGDIAIKVMNNLNVPVERQEANWLTHRTFVTKTLQTKRNNISMTLKDAYMSTYTTCR